MSHSVEKHSLVQTIRLETQSTGYFDETFHESNLINLEGPVCGSPVSNDASYQLRVCCYVQPLHN